jgi:hypothetical protein
MLFSLVNATQRNLLLLSSALKMVAAGFLSAVLTTYMTTQYNAEDVTGK